ncbi:phosphatidylglycerophosphatase A family protein [Sphaerotilaceae bacterium SBD11-9]
MTTDPPLTPPLRMAPLKPTARFMLRHPAHVIALGFGCGLSPIAPGTVGTLWAWLSFLVLQPHLTEWHWALVIGVGTLVGWWACTVTARHLHTADPGAIVWDEVLAFWAVLWLIAPAGGWGQLWAFVLFRFFDAVKPGPVAWADGVFKGRRNRPIGWRQGFGILFDDFIAALCALLVIALWRWF